MKMLVNILLGISGAACAAALMLQGFVFPTLPGWADLLLRLGAAMFLQILMLRLSKHKVLRYLPLIFTGAAAVWGFMLLLASPSWVNATVNGYLHDYASFFGSCVTVAVFDLLRPRMKKTIKKLLRNLKRRKKQKNRKDIPHS